MTTDLTFCFMPLFANGLSIVSLNWVDSLIIVIYFLFVLGIGFYLLRFAKTGDDFFLAGRKMTAWIAGLSFVAANLGSLELMGWAASAYQYGILATHWYWIGAIPAMLFLGLIMMPFYYISKTHSVPGYLKLRFGESSSLLSAISFGLMTVFMSGINMYAMAIVMKVVLGWDINFSIWVSSLTVMLYVVLGGLLSAILNEVLQFMLIWLGALLIPIIGMIEAGGWSGMVAKIHHNYPLGNYTHLWSTLGSFNNNPMGINWVGIVFGLGFVISFGYWTTDFLVVQRVLSAKDLRSAKLAPIIGAGFKMMVPLIVILPGLLGLAVIPGLVSEQQAVATGAHSYNEVLPLMLARYCGPGLLGLGITALIAGFMSGMAGNVSAFATVWTYDIYKPLLNKFKHSELDDAHYVRIGRWTTILGVIISIGTAYLVQQFASIMDYVQALFSFFIAPLFGTVILGMLWKRTTAAGGFWGLLAGIISSISMWLWVKLDPGALKIIALSSYAKDMAQDMFRALWSWIICVGVTVIVSYFTEPKPESQLVGLVRGCTVLPSEGHLPLVKRPVFWAAVILIVFIVFNLIFW
jgi:SSS family solute:Na+ symporter